jgi:hypothetical protein
MRYCVSSVNKRLACFFSECKMVCTLTHKVNHIKKSIKRSLKPRLIRSLSLVIQFGYTFLRS